MSIDTLPAPKLVTHRRDLISLIDVLNDQSMVAVDTESNSLFAYQEQVCLIQFSTTSQDFLVDPLALDDISGLAFLFRNPTIEKIFHAAEYDLICLNRDFGFEFSNLFDTMVASRILGRDEIGLGSLLEKEFDVHLNKKFQRANWGQRPLPQDQLDYARLDTHFLISLRNRLGKELRDKKLTKLADEDFARLSKIAEKNNSANKSKSNKYPWRLRGSYDLNPQQAAVLMELCEYREEIARAKDRPLFKVFNDQALINIALSEPHTYAELVDVRGVSHRQAKRHTKRLLRAVKKGLQAEPIYPPKRKRRSETHTQRIERLRQWRKITGRNLGVKSDIVLPRDILYEIAAENPGTKTQLAQIMEDVPWRFERFCDQILNTLLEE